MTKRIKQTLTAVLAFAALAVGASAIAGAATSTSSTSTSAGTPATGEHSGPPGGFTAANAPGTAAHEDAEKAVTGEAASKAQAAALATVSGGKAGVVTSDFRGGGYEVTLTKSDGTQVSVHLDSSFKVESHPGGPAGGQAGPGASYGQTPPSGQTPQAG
jgi:hypothetical protein